MTPDTPEFYAADPIEQVAVNLFYGWGYNFYRVENQLRADDLLVRHQVAGILGEARAAVGDAEAAYRREHLPPLSREHPRPDPAALRLAGALEALVARLAAASGRIRSLPAPANDRISQRHRQEAETLARLLRADMALTGQAESLRRAVLGQSPDWIVEHVPELTACLAAIDAAVASRQAILDL